jgi:transposase InsO family protein
MKDEGEVVGRHKVRRLMGEAGLRAIQPRSFVPRTTDSRHAGKISPNLLMGRELPPGRPNEVVVGDITYLPLRRGGFVYLASWEDMFSRMVVGWQIEETLEEKVVILAMEKAILRRRPERGLIVHSDRGGQYASKAFGELLARHGYERSMSRAGETYDNAYAESLFSRYKAELLEGGAFRNVEEARLETFHYIEGYYNRVRRHSSLGYVSPEEYERR